MTPATQPQAVHTGNPHLPYVVPFAAFLAILAISSQLQFLGVWEYPIRVAVLGAIVWVFSRHVVDFRVNAPVLSISLGVGVFAIWVAPESLFPDYRSHWLFSNSITGTVTTSLDSTHRENWIVLVFRTVRAAILVPIIEELFWRAWLMRWLINPNFTAVPLGTWTVSSMLISAALFASEHGPYWEVGLIAGFAYNFLMVRTRSLGDCILSHAVTNCVLSAYVIATGQWHYWG